MARAEIALEQHPPTSGERNGNPAFFRHSAQISYDSSAYFLRTPEVQEVLDRMLLLVLREVGGGSKIEVYGTAASDEIEAHLVVSAKTELPAEEALALWDRVGDAVQKWGATLSKLQEDITLDIAVEVLWDVDHAAA